MNVYALKNPRYPESSSGGAFPTIAEALHVMTGDELVVFGARFDEKFNVKHSGVKYVEGISLFTGSKYVRSDITEALDIITTLLQSGTPVLFVGTPCQVSIVRSRAKNKQVSDNLLFTVDLICHGTPKAEL